MSEDLIFVDADKKSPVGRLLHDVESDGIIMQATVINGDDEYSIITYRMNFHPDVDFNSILNDLIDQTMDDFHNYVDENLGVPRDQIVVMNEDQLDLD